MIPSLNDFKEQSRSVFYRFGEDLKQVSLVIVVDENLVLLKVVDVL